MSYGVRLHVSGERACFTRPEMKVERVSYDVMTPSAARGILEAIHWKPAIAWTIDRIHVLKPIRFQSFRRNEVGVKMSADKAKSAMRSGSVAGLGLVVEANRQQRATTLLVDVAYVIEAHFDLTEKARRTTRRQSISACSTGGPRAGNASISPASARASSRRISGCWRKLSPCPTANCPMISETAISAGCSTISTSPMAERRVSSVLVLTDGVLDVQRCLAEGEAA